MVGYVRGECDLRVTYNLIRTSVDHGVAFSKAGEGRANPQSMIQAIKMAARLAQR